MKDRWRSTRARLKQEGQGGEASGLWNRIATSRGAGTLVDLPAQDPRRPVRPVLIAALGLVVALAGVMARHAKDPTEVAKENLPAELGDNPAFDWFTTPAMAQSAGAASTLPRIDPPDLGRLVPQRLVYRYASGYDDRITEDNGIDTLDVARDTVAGQARVVISYDSWIRRASIPVTLAYSGADSLVLSSEGRFLSMSSTYARNDRPDQVSQRSVLISRDSIQFVGFSARLGKSVSRKFVADYLFFFETPFVALLPTLPLGDGYARSFSILDLVGGETSAGFPRRYELRVTGRKRVKVPAGSFRCWRVELSDGPSSAGDSTTAWPRRPTELYVDTETGRLVRAVWYQGNGYFREQTLMAASPLIALES